MDFIKKHFGLKLKLAIKNAGMTQSELAGLLEVEPASVSRWCNGHDSPTDDRLPDLLKLLQVSEDYFLGKDSIKIESEPVVTLTETQIRAITEEAGKNGAQSVLDAINKPDVSNQDDSPKGKMIQMIEGLSEKEAKIMAKAVKNLIDRMRDGQMSQLDKKLK